MLSETVIGVKNIRFPSHSFSHFKGMSKPESEIYRSRLWGILNTPGNIYLHDWKDGEMIFMDQNTTLHARSTNVKGRNKRKMACIISYTDRLYSDEGPVDYVMCEGEKYDHDTFPEMVDA